MGARGDGRRFGAVAMAFHWLTVALILAMVPIAWVMTDLPMGPDKFELYGLHKSLGITVLGLTVLRLAWRLADPPPPWPPEMPRWERWAARGSHVALYVVLFAMPIIGWVGSSAVNFPVTWFGLVTLPRLVDPDPALGDAAEQAHAVLSYVVFALVAVHVAAALRHHVMLRDDVLTRMLPFTGRRGGR